MARYIRLERNVVTEVKDLTQEYVNGLPPEENVVWTAIDEDLVVEVGDTFYPEENMFKPPAPHGDCWWDYGQGKWIR